MAASPPALGREAPDEMSSAVEPPGMVVYDDVQAADREAEKKREGEFRKEPEWNGQPLVLAVSVEAHFEEFRAAIGAPPWSQVSYESFTADAFRLLYLTAHRGAEYRHLRGDPVALQEAVEAWAEEAIGRERTEEAKEVAFELWRHRNDSMPEEMPTAHKPNTDEVGNGPGPSGKRNT